MKKQKQPSLVTQGLVQLSDSYNRSTNLELDFKDSSKLKNIYLSVKFQEGLKEVLTSVLEKNSNHRVRVLSGSPGLGKSTFALLTAHLLSKNYPQILSNIMMQANKNLQTMFQVFQKPKQKKLLNIFVNGYEGDIEKVFLNKLQSVLCDAKVPTNKNFQNTMEFYQKSLKALKSKGYGGVFVIYDEFGKYLEKGIHNPTDLNIQFLQNFAEFCNRSGETQCHLMLITHLSISQYASQLPINVQQEWAKIEGRFQESAFYDKSADYYNMISNVFKKNISKSAPVMAKKYKTYINRYLSHFKEDAFKGFIDIHNLKQILLNCFPLHPSVLALLPYLSKKVAQNERTLYTFLTRDENYSLKRFLEEQFKNHTTLLMPYNLYQYFQILIGKDIGIGGTYKIQLMAEMAFQQIQPTDKVAKQVISLMALCAVVNDAYFAPLTEEFICSCFNQLFSKVEIKQCLKKLMDKKVIFYNKNAKQYLLQEGTPIDIDEEIAKLKKAHLTSKSLVQVLKRYFKTDFIIPKKYNFDHSITRFYRTEIISVEELRSLKTKQIVDFYKEDGVVFYVVPFSHDELVYAKSQISNLSSALAVFVLPKTFIECKKDIEELNAVDCLYNNKEVLSTSSLIKKELDRHKEILLTSIKALLKPLIGYMRLSAYVAYPRQSFLKGTHLFLKQITHFNELQRYLGDLFEKEYCKYIEFNLEYMNRHRVSGSITLGRKKFIDTLIYNKQKPIENISDYIKGQGPDYVILDTMLRLSHFNYHASTNTYQVASKSPYYNFFKEYESILSKHSQGIRVDVLLDILVSPPFGLRLGVIPVFIALADLCFKQPVSHYFEDTYVKSLDGDHYDLLMKYPKKTNIHYTPIHNKQQAFLNGLKDVFNAQDVSIRSVIEAVLKWRKTIPESTKLSPNLSLAGRKILIQINSSKEPDKLLFNQIPNCFNKQGVDCNTNNKEIENFLNDIKSVKKEIDEVYKTLLLKIKSDLINFIQFINTQCLNSNFKLILKDKWVKSFQGVLLQVKGYPFSVHTSRFIGRVLNFDSSNYTQYFLETVMDVLTGASPRYWDSHGYSKFTFAIKRIRTEIEIACEIAHPHFKGQSVLAFIDRGKQNKTFIKLGAISHAEKHLVSSIKKIKMILSSVDAIDRRKIILSILESLDKESLAIKDAGHIDAINRRGAVIDV